MPSKLTVVHEEDAAKTSRLYKQANQDLARMPAAERAEYERVVQVLVWGNEHCASRELMVDAWLYVKRMVTKQVLEERWGVKL